MTEEIPEYLRRERESTKERKMMPRFKCWDEEGENRYWTRGEERRCRMCCEERRTVEHMRNGRYERDGRKGAGRNTE
jgi:hypothetical protein